MYTNTWNTGQVSDGLCLIFTFLSIFCKCQMFQGESSNCHILEKLCRVRTSFGLGNYGFIHSR